MKKILLAACAAFVFSTPAAARDNSAYFGLEVGPLWPAEVDFEIGATDFEADYRMGVDGDMIAGYDFGMFRAEGELAYKRSRLDEYRGAAGPIDAKGRASTYSGMINGMVDLGPDHDYAFYAGAGVGYAQFTATIDETGPAGFKVRDRGLAWQAFAGVRKSVSQYFEVGAKYRYFSMGDIDDDVAGADFEADYKTHSLLFSLIHSFAARPRPVVPPPAVVAAPPPPPPATQTCPDGSVVLATDVCPAPPPAPPPPAPEPIRG